MQDLMDRWTDAERAIEDAFEAIQRRLDEFRAGVYVQVIEGEDPGESVLTLAAQIGTEDLLDAVDGLLSLTDPRQEFAREALLNSTPRYRLIGHEEPHVHSMWPFVYVTVGRGGWVVGYANRDHKVVTATETSLRLAFALMRLDAPMEWAVEQERIVVDDLVGEGA